MPLLVKGPKKQSIRLKRVHKYSMIQSRDRLMPHMEGLVETTLPVEGPTTTSIRLLRNANPESLEMGSKQSNIWAFVWTACSVLADIASNVAALPRLPGEAPLAAIELGCGSGVVSLAFAAGGGRAVATDIVGDALRLLARSAELNDICCRDGDTTPGCGSGPICTHRVDWLAPSAASVLQDKCAAAARPDIVFGADVLYLESSVRSQLVLTRQLLCRGSTVSYSRPHSLRLAVFVDPGRFSRDFLEAVAPEEGLRVLLRRDLEYLPTPIACMRVCTVFVLGEASLCGALSDADLAADPIFASVMATVRGLEGRVAALAATGGPAPKCAYTLPPPQPAAASSACPP